MSRSNRTHNVFATLVLAMLLAGCAEGWDDGDTEAEASATPSAPPPPPRQVPTTECNDPWGDVTTDTLYNTPPSGMSTADWQRILTHVYAAQAAMAQICKSGKLREDGPKERPSYVTY